MEGFATTLWMEIKSMLEKSKCLHVFPGKDVRNDSN